MHKNNISQSFLSNIKTHYIFTAFKSFDTTQGIWTLYLASKGLSLVEIGLIEGIFHVTSLLMETPTGVIADLFGRKTSRIIGILFMILSNIVIITSSNFLFLAIGFVLSALSYNFESGADEALIYDSLIYEKIEDRYMNITGKKEIIFHISSVLSLLIGGFVGNIEYKTVYFIAIFLSIFSLIVAFQFKEPPIIKKESTTDKTVLELIKDQYKISFQAIRLSSKLGYLIVFTSIIFAVTTISFYYLQLGWESVGFTPFKIGIYLAGASIVAAIASYLADKIDKKFGAKKILTILPFFFSLSLFSMYFLNYAYIPFYLISFIEALVFVSTTDYLNQLISSEQRATILSFSSVMYSVVMILLFPLFGYLSDLISMKNTFLVLGGMILIFSFINLFSKEF